MSETDDKEPDWEEKSPVAIGDGGYFRDPDTGDVLYLLEIDRCRPDTEYLTIAALEPDTQDVRVLQIHDSCTVPVTDENPSLATPTSLLEANAENPFLAHLQGRR
ncbi:hypothetical protein SAMN05216388_102617 [Halorientalis persicus]|uniref:Uncharacterized protein n=1 Tax=Halorientalis persicus TaxID=1367881 RepID=A0A1H8U7R7_9EURY|nr:hypothetical protein [Halorientalis persicus]SEO99332.1 hypothetical protein SAMN05216388_102617 [Halorientalis persicus]